MKNGILLHGNTALFELLHHQLQIGRDVDGLAGGLDGVGHILQTVAGDHGHHGGVLPDEALPVTPAGSPNTPQVRPSRR